MQVTERLGSLWTLMGTARFALMLAEVGKPRLSPGDGLIFSATVSAFSVSWPTVSASVDGPAGALMSTRFGPMDSAFYSAFAGYSARMQALDVVANNLANASTNGFKA